MSLLRVGRKSVVQTAVLVVFASAGLAQSAPSANPDPMGGMRPPLLAGQTNAALLYFQAFERLSREEGNKITDKYTERVPGKFPDDETRKLLIANQRYVEDLMFAANTPACDFGVRYDEGFAALLPHLGLMRRGTRVLLADAIRLVRDGKQDEAGKRVAAIFHMADHTRNDRVLISSLVGAAITAAGIQFCEDQLAEGTLSNEVARAAMNALKDQHEEDYLGFHADIEGEGVLTIDWARNKFKGPTAGADFMRTFAEISDGPAREAANPMLKFDEEQLHADLDRTAGYYAEVRKVWDLPDASDKLAALEEEVTQGKHGLAARIVGASFAKVNISAKRAIADRALEIKRLDAFLRGEDPNKVAPRSDAKKGETKK